MSNIKKIILGVAVLLVLGYSLFNLQDVSKNSTITIGALLPLTGTSASIGERLKNGIELAAADIQEDGGNVKIIFEDDKGDASAAVSGFRKLTSENQLKTILGPAKSDATLAVAPIAESNKIVLLSPTAAANDISQAGDYIFRNIELPKEHGVYGAKFINERLEGPTKNIAVFIANASNAKSYGEAFITGAKEINLPIVSTANYQQADTDFRTLISNELAKKPQGIYLAVATAKDAGILVSQIREQDYTGLILMSAAANAKEFFDAAKNNTSEVYVSVPYFNPLNPTSAKYAKSYKDKYGIESDAFAANAYDATMLLYNAHISCIDKNTDCIRDYLYNTKDYKGVSGNTTFNSNGDVTKPVMILKTNEGKFVGI